MNSALVLNSSASAFRFLPVRLNLRIFRILIFLFVIPLLVFYIFQTNNMISDGYQIRSLQKGLDGTAKENRILEINYARTKSLEIIEKRVQELGFEKIGRINYFQVLENSVAVK